MILIADKILFDHLKRVFMTYKKVFVYEKMKFGVEVMRIGYEEIEFEVEAVGFDVRAKGSLSSAGRRDESCLYLRLLSKIGALAPIEVEILVGRGSAHKIETDSGK